MSPTCIVGLKGGARGVVVAPLVVVVGAGHAQQKMPEKTNTI